MKRNMFQWVNEILASPERKA
ncbi:MAG: hypothetical protein H6Q00_3176, partial [Holophagaceae bacterium]|nr:hypothetical protein [Holophagaceae bacterium]